MTGFIVRRLLTSVLVVILTSLFVFVLFFKGLGSAPARNYCEKLGPGKCTPSQAGLDRAADGLRQARVRQLRRPGPRASSSAATTSTSTARPTSAPHRASASRSCPATRCGTTSSRSFPATIVLAVGGATLYLTIGVFLGAMAARWRGTAGDRLLVGSTLIVSSIPFYLVALLAWIYLSLQLQIFPNTGYYPITENPAKTVSYMMLPWLVIGSGQLHGRTPGSPAARWWRRWVRTTSARATAKGVRTNRIRLQARTARRDRPGDHDLRHRLRHTLGRHHLHRADLRHRRHRPLGPASAVDADRPHVVSSTVLVAAVMIVMANLVVDILYSVHGPARERSHEHRSQRSSGRHGGTGQPGRPVPRRREPHRQVPDPRRPGAGGHRPLLHRRAGQDPRHRRGVRLGQVRVVDGRARACTTRSTRRLSGSIRVDGQEIIGLRRRTGCARSAATPSR